MKKVRIGVLGAYRGTSMINYCKRADHAEVVAICDKSPEALDAQRAAAEGLDIAFYERFDDFIEHDMDAVVLANYANEHVPYAIRLLKSGRHVMSEVLPCQTLKEAVELVEAVENTVIVSDYIFSDAESYDKSTQLFRKALAEIGNSIAAYADIVMEMNYGIPTIHKGKQIYETVF